MTPTWPEPITPPAGNAARFGSRWRLVGAGLSNVWRFGDLELPAPSGRLLLRGPNGTGKTTALEVLWPFLLDLNATRLAAGKARNTHLSSLMREAAEGRRRVGYVWLSLASPVEESVVSYGVRLSFSEGGAPPVRVTPFTAPGRPLHELDLWGPSRATLSPEQFAEEVARLGGTIFDDPEGYVRDLGTRIFASDARGLRLLAERIRQVRNPALLGELSPRDAADALRASLPGVADDIIEATGEALAESDATRKAFEDDRAAAVALDTFARVWTGHAVDVTATYHRRGSEAVQRAQEAARAFKQAEAEHQDATKEAEEASAHEERLVRDRDDAASRLGAIEHSAEYRAAGRLNDLARSVDSLERTADATWATLATAATQSATLFKEDLRHAANLRADIVTVLDQVVSFEPVAPVNGIFGWAEQARSGYGVGDRCVDAGPVLTVIAEEGVLDDIVTKLQGRAAELIRKADLARTFLTAYQVVDAAEEMASEARKEAGRLATTAEEKGRLAKAATTEARSRAAALADALTAWLADNTRTEGIPVSRDDLDDIASDEPSIALDAADRFEHDTATWANRTAERARARAEGLDDKAINLRAEAQELRAEVKRIRTDDILLSLPRPEWAGAGDDRVALGTALAWRGDIDTTTQEIVEATVGAAGLLGATLTPAGAATNAWAVDAHGGPVEPNLGHLLAVDRDHPLADIAAAVLARILLVPTATTGADTSAFVVGLDGTFRAGVLVASVPEAQDADLRPRASHIGAKRRREAALARAEQLDREAAQLDEQAVKLDEQAAAERTLAAHTMGVLARFPKRDPLRDAESARVAAARAQRDADEVTGKAEKHADALALTAREERGRWSKVVTGVGLPAVDSELTAIVATAKGSVATLTRVSRHLDDTIRRRIAELADAIAAHDTTATLDDFHAQAAGAFAEATTGRAGYQELHDQVGRSAAEVLRRHQKLNDHLKSLRPKVQSAAKIARQLAGQAVERHAELKGARRRAEEAEPGAALAIAELRALLAMPGVLEAILAADPDADDGRLLAQVAGALAGKERYAKRTLRERADETRAKLAGVWSIDPGPDHPELDTYLLTHGTTSFTPVAGVDHARLVAERAEEALRAADEQALREWLIGRLPAAIAQAWTRLFDWVKEVNASMKSASASSGVGVAVRVSVKAELPALVRTVYELACKTGAVLLDADARAKAGRALHHLINAADADDMTGRVRDAVDVREWVDVTYQVTRPGEEPKDWGSRTGLSSGERRLVVLAPMLAAVAAAYDKFAPTAARLAALDEVPSEVDEEGREGLARYIAQLDLDLIATSHQWDGAPGAWDGCDAYDLEAVLDGTVVGFPMLIRGLHLLPGDTVQ